MRLSSIGLFEQLGLQTESTVRFAQAQMGEKANPTVDALKSAVSNLNAESAPSKGASRICEYLNGLETSRQTLREKIRSRRAEIDGIFAHNDKANVFRDLMARRARVVGRISLWLDSMNSADNLPGKQATIIQLQNESTRLNRF